ncbi:MAG: hybrid sensor histidine kinase/response regulator [Gallionellaceae bacterium]|nr:hybrid sensor histidine kinase/response regulator [Gallionellaceae bacterium]
MMLDRKTAILVVDDFEPMRKVTVSQLRSIGANNILTANNGAEALRVLQKNHVDIVLSDWNMPVMTGLELLKTVRADAGLAHLPFIMITAEAERYRIEEAIAGGIDDLLVKPYTAICLAERIEKALTPQAKRSIPAVRAAAEIARSKAVPHDDPAAAAEPAFPQEPARPTILVVDDTADNLLLLSHLLNDEYRVRIAHSGDKALQICQSDDPPDLVLLDIMMPGMDGFEVARLLREHPASEGIPLIFVTAMTGEDERQRGMQLGAVDFVTKPIDPDALKLRVHNFMRYVVLHKQLQANYDGMLELARLREQVENITRHDMKGPLAGVIGLVQSLAYDSTLNSEQIGQLRMVEDTALQVLDMINLSSELFKIETGRFKLDAQPVAIGHILRRIVEISRTTFAEKHLVIAVDTDVPVGEELPKALGDDMFCYSLFQNLIKNACEAAPDNSQVSVVLSDEMPLRIIVQNTGTVPAEIRERFFDKFVTHGKQGGTGLGTYSARLLAEAQNGMVSLDVSDQDDQTTITVTLPRYSTASPLAVPPAPTFGRSP